MAQPLTVSLPPGLALWGGCRLRVTALDAASGNVVAGVSVSNITLEVDQTVGTPSELEFGPFMLVTGPSG